MDAQRLEDVPLGLLSPAECVALQDRLHDGARLIGARLCVGSDDAAVLGTGGTVDARRADGPTGEGPMETLEWMVVVVTRDLVEPMHQWVRQQQAERIAAARKAGGVAIADHGAPLAPKPPTDRRN